MVAEFLEKEGFAVERAYGRQYPLRFGGLGQW